MERVGAIIQARMGSTRLPGKVLKGLLGEPVLARVVSRVKRCAALDDIIVATSTEARDDAIAALCEREGWKCFRGSETDVLDRYYRAALEHRLDVVVRITSDCPLIEPVIVDELVRRFLARTDVDYGSNFLPERRFPKGLDCEVFRFSLLERLMEIDRDPASREHVTQYVEDHKEQFALDNLTHPEDLSDLRWTLDTPEDLAFVRKVYEHFGSDAFGWLDVLELVRRNPALQRINT